MVQLSEETIQLMYEAEQLKLEEDLLEDLKRGGVRHEQGNTDCGVFCVIEIVDKNPVAEMVFFGSRLMSSLIKIDLRFQGRKVDFEIFASLLSFEIDYKNFNITPAPEHKAPSMCTLNESPGLADIKIFENKAPINADLMLMTRGTQCKTGDISFVSITKHVVDFVKSTWLPWPICGHYPERCASYNLVPCDIGIATSDAIKRVISRRESSIQKLLADRNVQSKLTKVSTNQSTSTSSNSKQRKSRKSNLFRTAVKKRAEELAMKEKETETEVSSTDIHGTTSGIDQPGKSTKHQGNAKTFKRKSKRPGRV